MAVLSAPIIAILIACLAGCRSATPLLFENRLDRNLKVEAVVPTFTKGRLVSSTDTFQDGYWVRSTLVGDREIWDASAKIDGEQWNELIGMERAPIRISIRDASLVAPRFSPISVWAEARPGMGYLALAEAIDGTLYLILADDSGSELDRASAVIAGRPSP